jgi:hypothetical protein
MTKDPELVRIIRIFVSSPSDVGEERKVLDEVVRQVNETDGQDKSIRLELFRWERNVVPQIGPSAQKVVDDQTPAYGIYLGIMSKRFGTPSGPYGSGTEKEFRDALERWGKTGAPWILFYFNAAPMSFGTQKELKEYNRVWKFRNELQKLGLVGTYEGVRGSERGFYEQAGQHLRLILRKIADRDESERPRKRTVAGATRSAAKIPSIPKSYLEWLKDQCADVDLLGLELKQGQTARLNNVYVPLTTSTGLEGTMLLEGRSPRSAPREHEKPQLLLDLAGRGSLFVSGAPGSGKSTFSRWVAWLTCSGSMPDQSIKPEEPYLESFPKSLQNRLPVLVRLREFWSYLPETPDRRRMSRSELESTLSVWMEKSRPGGLRWSEFASHLIRGSAFLILDGLDEVPLARGGEESFSCPREMLISGLIDAIPAWIKRENRVLLTSRPYGIAETEVKALGMLHAPIEELAEPLQQLLIRRWFHVLGVNAQQGEDTAREMIDHIGGREDLGPLSGNPMLLTAMCIVYHEGKRLPHDKSDLYTRTVDKVLYNRYPNEPRLIEPVRTRLSVLAYGIHTGAGLGEERTTPLAEVTYSEIDRMLESYRGQSRFSEPGFKNIVETREGLLSRSGLLLPRGNKRAGFYHFSFQEYLAAQRMLDLECDRLFETFMTRAALPEWRNTLSFAFSSMLGQPSSRTRAQQMLERFIESITPESSLGLQVVVADCIGIVLGKGSHPAPDLAEKFERICLDAIEREVPLRERMVLGLALGQLGDPRITLDLREPGGYVKIPAGDYVIHYQKRPYKLREPFLLARYPVTNGQYSLFIEEKGYENPRWWSDDGRKWLEETGAREPEYWRSSKWNGANQPVVGVSFWEAEAFCNWAGGRLPAEEEWEAASRGPEGFEYPWGNEWNVGIVNSREAELGVTSPVGLFPRSRSRVFGLEDMAGNVLEWTNSCKDLGADRILRGSSWIDGSRHCRSAMCFAGPPANRLVIFGFRPARSLPSSL